MRIGTVISSSVEQNRDGVNSVRMLQVQIADPDDIQSVEWAHAAGDEYNPAPGDAVVIVELGAAWKMAIAADSAIAPSLNPGEREIYSHAAGAKMARLTCLLDGTVEAVSVNGVAGNDYVAIASKIDQIIATLDGVFRGWVVAPNDGGGALKLAYTTAFPTAPLPTASTNLKADK